MGNWNKVQEEEITFETALKVREPLDITDELLQLDTLKTSLEDKLKAYPKKHFYDGSVMLESALKSFNLLMAEEREVLV